MGERAYSLYDIEQFIREAGAERVTEDAVLDLEREMERLTEMLASKAIRYAEHAGRRRLIKKQDVLLTRRPSYRNPVSLRAKASRTNATSTSER